MQAFAGEPFEKALFVSPVLDMEQLIRNMMLWAGAAVDQPLVPQHEAGEEEKGAQKGATELFVHGCCSNRKEESALAGSSAR